MRIEINPPPSTKEVGVRCEVGIGMSEVFFLQSTGRKSCLLQRFNNTKSTKIQSLWPAITVVVESKIFGSFNMTSGSYHDKE